jgi:hypothetical protein
MGAGLTMDIQIKKIKYILFDNFIPSHINQLKKTLLVLSFKMILIHKIILCSSAQAVWTNSNLFCIPDTTDIIVNWFRQNFTDQTCDEKLMTKALLIC